MNRRIVHNRLYKTVRSAFIVAAVVGMASCERRPKLHLFGRGAIDIALPVVRIDIDTYWNYEVTYGVAYDWRAEWFYGWDDTDRQIFGPIGYTEPNLFQLRCYFSGDEPGGEHTKMYSNLLRRRTYKMQYNWGYWDFLVWNDVESDDGVQSLNFDERTMNDPVIAYTNQTMSVSRYQAPAFTRSFFEPEQLFSNYKRAVEIDPMLDDFEYDPVNDVYVKQVDLVMVPITYIYLTQVILHHNQGRIVGVDGTSNLSGVARTTEINSGTAGSDAVTVQYSTRFKPGCNMNGEKVDIVGGRVMTFGICDLCANRVVSYEYVKDANEHYIDVNMQFNNGMDSTFVFNVTDQVRRRYKGGVITVELDMDTIPMPSRKGGSGFDAVVKDFEDGGTHEFGL